MIRWEAHACLPLHPQADFAPIDRLHAAGVTYVSINVGMDMNPLSQVMSVIGGFRATTLRPGIPTRLIGGPKAPGMTAPFRG